MTFFRGVFDGRHWVILKGDNHVCQAVNQMVAEETALLLNEFRKGME